MDTAQQPEPATLQQTRELLTREIDWRSCELARARVLAIGSPSPGIGASMLIANYRPGCPTPARARGGGALPTSWNVLNRQPGKTKNTVTSRYFNPTR